MKYPLEQNMPHAQFLMGIYYYENADIEKEIYYFQLSADQNYSRAGNNLGIIYSDKSYKKYDIEKAIRYFRMAASNGDENAQFNLQIFPL